MVEKVQYFTKNACGCFQSNKILIDGMEMSEKMTINIKTLGFGDTFPSFP